MDLKKFLADNKKTVLIVLGLLLLAFLLKKYWWKIERFFKAPPSKENSQIPLTDARKSAIEGTASLIYTDIYNTPLTGHNYSSYDTALGYYDDELEYCADYYQLYLASNNSVHSDIQSQWYTWGDSPERLQTKLAKVNKM